MIFTVSAILNFSSHNREFDGGLKHFFSRTEVFIYKV